MPGSVAGWIPWRLAGGSRVPAGTVALIQWAGLPLIMLGWGILLWCARDFARRGRGTPAPYDPPRALVTSGLYRFTRNPMYVGVVTAILGQGIWYQSGTVAIYALCVAGAFHLAVLLYEEPRLTQSFGEAYAEYRRQVPRWVPRFPIR